MPKQNPQSCWTCRLRHKKCDETKPACGQCAALQISCIYSQTRPRWMDSGPLKNQMIREIKNQVKTRARRRRFHGAIQEIERKLQADVAGSDILSTPADQSNGEDLVDEHEIQGSPQVLSNHVPLVNMGDDSDLHYIMIYIDHIFPIIFPFYRPSVLEGGRSWMLSTFLNQETMRCTIRALTVQFLAIVPCRPSPVPLNCASAAQEDSREQTTSAIRQLQEDLGGLIERGPMTTPDDVLRETKVLNGVVHMLNAEKILSAETWHHHLDPAIAQLGSILQSSIAHGTSAWVKVLNTLRTCASESMYPIWSADQAAFRFSVGSLLVDDILASVSLETPPKLEPYWPDILGDNPSAQNLVHLNLEDLVGCQNWAMQGIGQVSTLAAWKKEMVRDEMLQRSEIKLRGSIIENWIRERLVVFMETASGNEPDASDFSIDTFTNREIRKCSPTITLIWAHTALLFLQTVVSGWSPLDYQVRESLAKLFNLFSELSDAPTVLHTLAFPLAIAGCLSTGPHEGRFQTIIKRMGALANLGAMRSTVRIVENAWRNRDHVVAESQTMAACLNNLGYAVLLS
ncbi:unnamed protein product [Clonostachys rhizophaga]|uniref:Zn(2)-C6 fungal-type domain-containing protein n=1 Tax=Clonostachys rhizophaga TaxID=160324 RepID=A0A9N9VR01_9HYPO|nr:unnamed protein product [Clonostachys rhizophaga]